MTCCLGFQGRILKYWNETRVNYIPNSASWLKLNLINCQTWTDAVKGKREHVRRKHNYILANMKRCVPIKSYIALLLRIKLLNVYSLVRKKLLSIPPDSHLAVHDDRPPQAAQQVLQADIALLPPGDQAVVLWHKGPQRVSHQAVQTLCLHLVVQLQHLPAVTQLEVTWREQKTARQGQRMIDSFVQ